MAFILYRKATDEIRRMAAALQDLSLPPGSNIAILSKIVRTG